MGITGQDAQGANLGEAYSMASARNAKGYTEHSGRMQIVYAKTLGCDKLG